MQAKVCGGSPGGRSETTGVGFVKQVGFKPGVKERWSYRCTEWWVSKLSRCAFRVIFLLRCCGGWLPRRFSVCFGRWYNMFLCCKQDCSGVLSGGHGSLSPLAYAPRSDLRSGNHNNVEATLGGCSDRHTVWNDDSTSLKTYWVSAELSLWCGRAFSSYCCSAENNLIWISQLDLRTTANCCHYHAINGWADFAGRGGAVLWGRGVRKRGATVVVNWTLIALQWLT